MKILIEKNKDFKENKKKIQTTIIPETEEEIKEIRNNIGWKKNKV